MSKSIIFAAAVLSVTCLVCLVGTVVVDVVNDGKVRAMLSQSTGEALAKPSEPSLSSSVELEVAETDCQRIPDYDRPPQPQIGHPSFYIETGVNTKTMCWMLPIKEGFVAVIGGFTVDGVSGGVYKAIDGPATVTTRVTDGFAAIAVEEVARGEFCFRVGQAVEYGWAHNTVEPLAEWTACESLTLSSEPAPEEAETTTLLRRPTGQEQSLRFKAGEAVVGWRISLDSGPLCDEGNCYLTTAPGPGSVTSGVVNPWPTEVEGITPWNPSS